MVKYKYKCAQSHWQRLANTLVKHTEKKTYETQISQKNLNLSSSFDNVATCAYYNSYKKILHALAGTQQHAHHKPKRI